MRRPDSRWIVKEPPEEAATAALARSLGVPPLVARLLLLRGHATPAAARAFLAPRLADLPPPDGLPDVDRAADRLARAVRDGERIAIYGDYDVDGMTGTALLVRFFRLAEADVIWGIPDRDADGYGLGCAAVDRLADAGAQVVVTVDNGVGAHDAVARAGERGMDVVITDHHLPGDTLPDAYAIVNPHRRDQGDHGTTLCGCGLAFKLAWAVADRLRGRGAASDVARFRAFLRDGVGLVALATVADVVPLVGENRILVAGGLAALRGSRHPGIRALLASARLGENPLTTDDVAFRIGPRLNAAGRLNQPGLVIDLLTTGDADEAARLMRRIEAANEERRRIEQEVLAQAQAVVADTLDEDRRSLVVHGEGWHRGVIGIVAARLVDRHHRPTVVIGFEDGIGRGSGRTPRAVDLHRALASCEGHLDRFGGHAAAAGLEIRQDAVEDFAEAFEAAVRTQTTDGAPQPTVEIDAEVVPADLSLETVESVLRLVPFGASNPEPLFLVRGAHVAGRARLMGRDDAHLTFSIQQPGGAIRVVAFRQAARHDLVAGGGPLDLVAAPMLNVWRGRRTPELRLVDVRPARDASPATPGA